MGCGCAKKSNPTSSCGTNCFKAANQVVSCDDSVGPCGLSGSKDLSTLNTQLNGCTDGGEDCDVTYQLVSFDSNFEAVTISSDGETEYTTSDSALANTLGVIRYRIFCACNNLSATAKLYVCIKDLCANVLCEEDFECNKCTGACDPIIPNAILS